MVTRAQAARRLGISRSHVRRLESNGELTPSFVNGAQQFDQRQLDELAAARAAKRAAPTRPSVTSTAATRMLGGSRAHLRRLEARGAVRAVRVGGVRYYDLAELEQIAAERAAREPSALPQGALRHDEALAVSHEPAVAQPIALAPRPGLAISGAQLTELCRMLNAKRLSGAELVARVRALLSDYEALDAELRRTEGELAERVVELAELRAVTSPG